MHAVSSGSAKSVLSQNSFPRTTVTVAGHRELLALACTRGHKSGPATYGGGSRRRRPMLAAPAAHIYEVLTEMFRPPLPLELGGATPTNFIEAVGDPGRPPH
ncbi:hypothetical protein HPB50_002744 [Hyalomma asiaticum]|uniref:Uncharacterized protein n=1 Tax=Hyalomma asiaticum TaxID=266040 RepID=A0ACB7TA40_HYAAI|nr:hypothetical protein HPB50_002744 [Hyalomma asiaticum]